MQSKIKQILSPRTGIIQELFELMIEPDDPSLFHVIANLADTSKIFTHKTSFVNGGAGLTKTIAEAAAAGECLERYCLGSGGENKNFIFSSYKNLQKKRYDAIEPEKFALFSKKQYSQKNFKIKKFTKDSQVDWVWGYSMTQKKPILVPAALVYIPYRNPKSEPLCDVISTGAACASSMEEAILRGIYEVVERDALMIMWFNKISCPLIQMDSNDEINQIFKTRFCRGNLKYYVVNMTLDIPIPAIFVLIVDKNDGTAVSCGAASNLNIEKAILKALIESVQTRLWLKALHSNKPPRKYNDDFSDINSFKDHVLLYGRLDSIINVDFIINNKKYQKIISSDDNKINSGISTDLDKCIQMLKSKNLDVIYVDVTTDDVRKLGFHVVKVLIPGMIDLNVRQKYRLLGGKRIYQVPKHMGFSNKENDEDELNKDPHPFP